MSILKGTSLSGIYSKTNNFYSFIPLNYILKYIRHIDGFIKFEVLVYCNLQDLINSK
jgi:hypothetical protein